MAITARAQPKPLRNPFCISFAVRCLFLQRRRRFRLKNGWPNNTPSPHTYNPRKNLITTSPNEETHKQNTLRFLHMWSTLQLKCRPLSNHLNSIHRKRKTVVKNGIVWSQFIVDSIRFTMLQLADFCNNFRYFAIESCCSTHPIYTYSHTCMLLSLLYCKSTANSWALVEHLTMHSYTSALWRWGRRGLTIDVNICKTRSLFVFRIFVNIYSSGRVDGITRSHFERCLSWCGANVFTWLDVVAWLWIWWGK